MKAIYCFKQKHPGLMMTLLIFIVIPIAAGLAFGYEMGYNRIQMIPTVIADYDNTEFSRTLVEYIGDSDIFQVAAYARTDGEAEEMIAEGSAMTAVIIPEGLSAKMRSGEGPKIEVLYDGTMMTVASSAKAAMSEILMTVKAGYMKSIYEGKLDTVEYQAMNQIMPIDAAYRTLFNPTKNYRNFLLPGMLAALVQVGFAIMGLSRSLELRERFGSGLIRDLGLSIWKIGSWAALGAVSLILCLGVQYLFFDMPYNGSVAAGLVFTYLFALAVTAFGFTMGQIIRDRVFAAQATCVLVLPTSILGGYTFPLMAMPPALQTLGKILPFSYYGDGIRRLCLAEVGLQSFVSDFWALLKITGVELLILAAALLIRGAAKRRGERTWGAMTLSRDLLVKGKDVLVVFLIPILFTLLFGYLYSNVYVDEIPIAVLDMDHSINSDLVTDSFDDSSGMRVTARADTESQLEDMILSGQAMGGLVIPPNFGEDVLAKKAPGLLVLIDGSNIVIGNNLYACASAVVTTLNVGIQANILEGGDVVPYTAGQYLSTLSFTDRMLYDPQLGYFRYIFAGVLGILIQQTYLSSLIPKFMGEKQRLAAIPWGDPAGKVSAAGLGGIVLRTAALSAAAFLCCLMIANRVFAFPLRGSAAEMLTLLGAFLLCMTAEVVLFTSFFDDTAHCTQFAMFLSIPTFLTSGYVWPEFMMAPGFAPAVKAVWPLYYLCNPLRDVCMKGAGFEQIGPYLRGGLLFAALWLPVSFLLYRRKVKALRKAGNTGNSAARP